MDTIIPSGNYIDLVEVDKLFGDYDYRLDARHDFGDPRILILYGQNGSGKTTVLKLIRSLLSAEHGSGHRGWLSRVPFRRVSIHLGEYLVEATRGTELTGTYHWSIKKAGQEIVSMTMEARHGHVDSSDWSMEQRTTYDEIRTALISIVSKVTFLDDRRTFIDRVRPNAQPRMLHKRLPDGTMVQVPSSGEQEEDDPVYSAFSELAHAVRREALQLSNRGSQGAQSIYTSLVNRIASKASLQSPLSESSIAEIVTRLNDEKERSDTLSRYGLATSVDHAEMLRAISEASPSNLAILATVLEPYVESLSARFDALEVLHNSLDRWIGELGEFLRPKQIRYKVGDEVQVASPSGQVLSVGVLSSGERHLLFLMTKAFLLRSSGGLLLIDEPELSLNVAWQRGLIAAMVGNFGTVPSQLVVASHSLEMLTRFEANVVEMTQ